MGRQRRLGIYVGYDSPSIIRYLEPSTGDVFTARFADCHFNENLFPPFVTSRFPVRPDWRIRTEFGVRDYILGLFTFLFIFIFYNWIKISYTYQKNYHRSGVHQIYTHILSPIYKYKTVLLHLQFRAHNLHVVNPY